MDTTAATPGSIRAASLPNVLTYLRILAVPAVALCLFLIPGDAGRWWALGIYVADIYTLFNERPDAFHAALEEVLALHARGILRPHVHAVVPLREAAKAHGMIERAENLGKVVLDIDG